MKSAIHPKWFAEAQVSCACGNKFSVSATVPSFNVEVCSKCHPFYTGQMKFLDTAGRVDAFEARRAAASKKVLSKTERRSIKRKKRMREDFERPETLTELRKKRGSKN